MAPETATLAVPAGVAPAFRDFHCSGCGRRQFRYAADTLGRDAVIQVRCRDCKTTSELRGADVAALLHALSHGRGGG
jgi:hypothetical protein